MISFSDFGIELPQDDYTEDKISINDVVNSELVVLGFKPNIHTKNGDRHLVRIEVNEKVRVMFTGGRRIIEVLENPKVKFPFTTIIKTQKIGDKRAYFFT